MFLTTFVVNKCDYYAQDFTNYGTDEVLTFYIHQYVTVMFMFI